MTEWRRPFVTVTVVILVVELAMVGLGTGPQVVLIAALGAFLGAVLWFVRSMADEAQPALPVPPRSAGEPTPKADPRVRALRSGIVFSRSRSSYSERLHAPLIAIIDDQLAFAHGIDREADPEAADAVLGAELAAFVRQSDDDESYLDPTNLDRIVTQIEQL